MTLHSAETGAVLGELRRAEERFRLLVEAVVDYAIYLLDPAGHVTTWNAGAQKIKGYTAGEIVGRSCSTFFPEEDVRAGKPQRELELARRHGRFEQEGVRVRKDGSSFWANVVITPIYDDDKTLVGFANVTRDLTSRVASEETARRLAAEQAGRAAAEAAAGEVRDSEAQLRALTGRLEAILGGVADGIIVQSKAGAVTFANAAAAHLCGFESPEEMIGAASQEVNQRFDLYDEAGFPFPVDELPGRRALRGEPAGSALMRVRQRASGKSWWALVRASSVPGDAGTPELAVTVWHDVTLERQREMHDRYLAKATAALASSIDYDNTLSTLATLLVPGLADWCTIQLLEEGQLRPVATAHVNPERVRFARRYQQLYPSDPAQPRGVWNVLRTGRSELFPNITDELLAQSARDPEHLSILRGAGMKSVLIVPIRTHERVLGTISLVFAESDRQYGSAETTLAEELGQRAGNSIENARLFAAEKSAREHVGLLARAGEAFSDATSYEEMLTHVVSIAIPTLADFAFFDLVEGESVRRIARAHDDEAANQLVASTQWVRSERRDKNLCALSSGESAMHAAIDEAWFRDVSSGPEQLEMFQRLQLRSMVTVPLRARDQVLGALTLCFGKSGRNHTKQDLELAEELARRAALAVLQARLYREAGLARARAEQAAQAAEEANRVKDEFLATVSHELRTPLQSILGWSAILQQVGSDDAALQKGLAAIHRNALAQGKIVEDILDVSRIIGGHLRVRLEDTDIRTVVRDAIEAIAPSTAAKKLAVDYVAPDEPMVVAADPVRFQQVVWNLLSNSLKFSDEGGRIEVRLLGDSGKVRIIVSDTGRGIEPAFLPFVFDRFAQADSSSTRRVGGLGLGLAIVRYVVELHGGRVEARSEGEGKGATFEVTLPMAQTS